MAGFFPNTKLPTMPGAQQGGGFRNAFANYPANPATAGVRGSPTPTVGQPGYNPADPNQNKYANRDFGGGGGGPTITGQPPAPVQGGPPPKPMPPGGYPGPSYNDPNGPHSGGPMPTPQDPMQPQRDPYTPSPWTYPDGMKRFFGPGADEPWRTGGRGMYTQDQMNSAYQDFSMGGGSAGMSGRRPGDPGYNQFDPNDNPNAGTDFAGDGGGGGSYYDANPPGDDAPHGAARGQGFQDRADNRRDARLAANAAPDPTGANRGGIYADRADRRQAARQAGNAVDQGDSGGSQSGAASDPQDPTGANRDGMGWRGERRAAVNAGYDTTPGGAVTDANGNVTTGANRAGMQYRADRRAANGGAAPKPGQPAAS